MPTRPFLAARLALLALALAACSARAERLVVWMVGDDKVPRLLAPAVEAFRARRPDVEVEIRDVPWGDAMMKYSAALASGRGPDILTGGTTFGIDLGAKGGLVDLAQRAPDLAALLERHANPGVMRSVRRPDGTLYGAPFDMHTQLQFYRTDLVARAPADWQAFKAEVQRLRAAGTRGFAQQWGNTGWLGWAPYLYQAGGRIYDAACTRSLVDSPEAQRALAYYASLYRELHASTDSWPDADGGLETGAYPLIQSGTWQLSALDVTRVKLRGKWAAAPLPAGPTGRRTAELGGTVMGVTAFSPRIELALDFMRTVYQADVTAKMAVAAYEMGLMWLPAGRADQLGVVPMPAERKAAMLAQFADAEGPPNCPGWQRNDYVLTRAVQRVVLAGADAKTELGRAAAALTRALGPRAAP